MHALGQLVRRVAAIITAIAVCGMFAVRAERTGRVNEVQFSATKAPLEYAAVLPENFGKVSGVDSWSKPGTSTPVAAKFVVPKPVDWRAVDGFAVSRSDTAGAPLRLTGIVELRI